MRKNFSNIILSLAFISYFISNPLIAQDDLSIHSLLEQIRDQQVQQDAFFIPGIFPSYISKRKVYKEKRKDNNIFFTALIVYTLNTLKPKLSATDRDIVDSIVSKSEKSIRRFKNTKGRESYNFWRTDSAYRFPLIPWMRFIKKNILADDPDCTSMCLMALNAPDSSAENAHAVMQDYVNDIQHPTKTTVSKYRPYAAYSGWLWENAPVVFDICALTNILSFVQTYNFGWTKADSASLSLIVKMLKNKDHINDPIMISPYYGNTSIILYHIARLMNIKFIPVLEAMKNTFITDALSLLRDTHDELEKVILNNALLRWDYKATIPDNFKASRVQNSDLPFVIASIPSFLNVFLKKPLTDKGIGIFYYYCPAYNNLLLLENLVLKNTIIPDQEIKISFTRSD